MPNTTTVTYPTLTAGRVARASDVESKFDWLEHSIWPMANGNFTDNTYDLGNSTTAMWRTLWAHSWNATTTAQGVAIGTTTVNNNSSTALEIAGSRAVLLPRLTTTQRDALTPTNGHFIYNSTTTQFEGYQNGAWQEMSGGPAIGLIAKVRASSISATTQTAVSIGTGITGRLVSVLGISSGGFTHTSQMLMEVILDSVSTGEIGGKNTLNGSYLSTALADTTASIDATITSTRLDLAFRDQLRVYYRSTGGADNIVSVMYEREA